MVNCVVNSLSSVAFRFAQSAKYLRIKDEEEDMEVDSVISGESSSQIFSAYGSFLQVVTSHHMRLSGVGLILIMIHINFRLHDVLLMLWC